ncbi:hypothetical protein FSZ31_04575 [Sphingorhabdus soli]|uniref:SH3 domain-containing protein n=1 Tax=Flavisphingopyxis soli TaxID=2601267 RepID=A0A5C6UN63_9SPHN|nr:SH3 domain-containing protein [Sphingorhabdus soli]TXC74000.1 hypothetical protein FSZ31_04575 [Sphingorhabdus soli]
MRYRPLLTGLLAVLAVGAGLVSTALPTPVSAQSAQDVPYWASISQSVARMRKGPSPDLPAIWEYRREDLPVKVLERYQTWRKIQDPDGTIGWMAARLLSAQRTGYVVGGIRAMHVDPNDSSPIAWRAEPGVVGRLSDCANGWCYFDVKGKRGYIRSNEIWGGEAP